MSDFNSLKQKAEQLRKEKKFQEALPIYKNLWENFRDDCNEWIGWGYAYCLQKTGQYNEGLKISREVYKHYPDFNQIKNTYAWCIYYTEIRQDEIKDEEKFLKAANAITELTNQDDKFSPYTITCFKVIDYLTDKPNYNPDKISEWLDKLNPDKLSEAVRKVSSQDNPGREIASDKEKWYKTKSDILLEKGKYRECIELSQKALNIFSKLHYGNEVWLKRNIALAQSGLKDYEEAFNLLMDIYSTKPEWFIEKDISEILYAQKRYDEALKYAVKSALNFGESKSKIKLYGWLIDLLKVKKLNQYIKPHIELIYSIRNKHNWKIDNKLTQLVNEYQINVNSIRDEGEILKELKPLWEKLRFEGQTQLTGKIKNIFADGKSGFIETDDKKAYYFKAKDFLSKKEKLTTGRKVSFYLEDSFDRKKNQLTKCAVNIKALD
ncbi:MAG: hypothetical protein WHV63_02365 [Ignavibacteria bacterium]|nr:hypothetical protein [Ignavibacteria bacterium]